MLPSVSLLTLILICAVSIVSKDFFEVNLPIILPPAISTTEESDITAFANETVLGDTLSGA